MICFGVSIEPDDKEYMNDFVKRLRGNNIVTNPFTGYVRRHQTGFYTIGLRPVYPNPTIFGVIGALVLWVFFGGGWWLFIPQFIIIVGFVGWTRWLYALLLKIALQRRGVKMKLLPDTTTIWRVSGGTTRDL